MPNLNVEISDELLRAIRIKCAVEGTTQKDWVSEVLTAASLGEGVDGARTAQGGGGRGESDSTIGLPPAPPTKMSVSDLMKDIPGLKTAAEIERSEDCADCGSITVWNRQMRWWQCTECSWHGKRLK